MIRLAALLVVLGAASAWAQPKTTSAQGALLRALDKINGETTDLTIEAGRLAEFGRLTIVLRECRYPEGNPSGNAYAALEVSEVGRTGTVFSGWMIASAPALSAMDHPRYDVWVMRCIAS